MPDEYAVKWLEPQECMPTMLPHAGKVIWMARNHREQAKSAVKFLRRVGGFQIPERQTRAAFERSYKRDTPIAVRAWARLCPVHVEFFEDVLREPLVVARRITAFTGRPLDIEAMAAQVRARSSDCYDGFLELELMNERESA